MRISLVDVIVGDQKLLKNDISVAQAGITPEANIHVFYSANEAAKSFIYICSIISVIISDSPLSRAYVNRRIRINWKGGMLQPTWRGRSGILDPGASA